MSGFEGTNGARPNAPRGAKMSTTRSNTPIKRRTRAFTHKSKPRPKKSKRQCGAKVEGAKGIDHSKLRNGVVSKGAEEGPNGTDATTIDRKQQLFPSGTLAATAWEKCGGRVLDFMSRDEIICLTTHSHDAWNSVAAWLRVADLSYDDRMEELAHCFPHASGALNAWASNQRRGALTPRIDPALTAVVQYLRRAFYQFRREASHLPTQQRSHLPTQQRWMQKHKNIRRTYFPILFDWLVELHFDLNEDDKRSFQRDSPLTVVHRAMKYLFFYLDTYETEQTNTQLQLVGVSCYSIALELAVGKSGVNKLNFDSKRYSYYTDYSFKPEEIENMTHNIKSALEDRFRRRETIPGGAHDRLVLGRSGPLLVETPAEALTRIESMINTRSGTRIDTLVHVLTSYVMDLLMHDAGVSFMRPSCVASAALAFACTLTGACIDREWLLICSNVKRESLERQEKYLGAIYTNAKIYEAGYRAVRELLPKKSVVIRYYRRKIIKCMKGMLEPRFKKNVLLGRSRPLGILSEGGI